MSCDVARRRSPLDWSLGMVGKKKKSTKNEPWRFFFEQCFLTQDVAWKIVVGRGSFPFEMAPFQGTYVFSGVYLLLFCGNLGNDWWSSFWSLKGTKTIDPTDCSLEDVGSDHSKWRIGASPKVRFFLPPQISDERFLVTCGRVGSDG